MYHNNTFCVLDGVVLKISDKFKPPPRVSLPISWSPADSTELLAFQYDFEKEKQSINLAEEERLIKERNNLKKLEEQLELEKLSIQNDELEDGDLDNNKETEESGGLEDMSQILLPSVATAANQNEPLKISKSNIQPINFHEFESQNQNPFELVELQTLNEFDELRSVLDSGGTKRKKIQSKKLSNDNEDFQLDKSFVNPVQVNSGCPENNNLIDTEENDIIQTSFAINNIPLTPHAKNGTLAWTRFDEDFNYFNPFAVQTNPSVAKSQNQLFLSDAYNKEISRQLSKSPPGISSDSMYTAPEPIATHVYSDDSTLTRTKSLPNLIADNADYEFVDESFVSKATAATDDNYYMNLNTLDLDKITSKEKSLERDNLYSQNGFTNTNLFAPTDRINNIMKQYQFQRISSLSNSQSVDHPPASLSSQNVLYGNISTTATDVNKLPGYPVPHNNIHSVIQNSYSPPILKNASSYSNETSNYTNPTSVLNKQAISSYSVHSDTSIGPSSIGPMLIQSKPVSNNQHSINLNPPFHSKFQQPVEQSSFERVQPVTPVGSIIPLNNEVLFRDNGRTGFVSSEQNIPIAHPNSTQQSINTSWLIDETYALSTSEKNFATQLSGMGFPLPCVSRTIKRLGKDQKEVLDFLCLLQAVKDEHGYEISDVEVALINNENDKEKTVAYLKMVSTFRELGFQPKSIHDALKETSCDQNKALDFLTR